MTNADQPRVLIVDDEDIVLDSCQRILKASGYDMRTAADGSRGLELAAEFQPDLVLVDLKMPGISGFDVIEQLRAIDPTIVTIVITGYATVATAVEAMQKGAYDFLPKPFTPVQLRLIAQRGLERGRLVRETMALRKEREMLREHFAAIVSHELKSPLAAVQQNLFVLSDQLADKLTTDEQATFGRMKASIDTLLKLIHTWLRVISVDMDSLVATFHTVAVAPLIATAVETMQPHATRKNIQITSTVDPATGSVHGDEGTLLEALVNILSNAIKYSRVDSTIDIVAAADAGEASVAIADHGVGISPEDLPHIFADFYVGKSAEHGSGLGLAITKRIIEAHRGTISVDSTVGQGSVFTIRIPQLSDADDTAASGDASETIDT